MGPFGLLADFTFLKQNGVVQMFQLRMGQLPPINTDNVVYVMRAELSLIDMVADNLFYDEKERKREKKNHKMHILFMPRGSQICEKKLGDLGVRGNVETISEYQVEMYPFDSDVISMELPLSFKDIYIDNDTSSLFHVATALMKLQALFGVIPFIYGQGRAAKHVTDLITRMRRELGDKGPQVAPQFDYLLLLDRSVDLITPLVTQRTYEGLIDEFYGIKNNHVKLPPEKFVKDDQPVPSEPKTLVLNSGEELFDSLRDKHYNAVGVTLKQVFQSIAVVKDSIRDNKLSVQDLRQVVQQMPKLEAQKTSATTHVSIAELIKEGMNQNFQETVHVEHEFLNGLETDPINVYIEDSIAKEEDLTKVLRLICLQSLTNGGLKPKVLEHYKKEIIQTYGYQHILTLQNLEKAGLLKTTTLPASYLSMGVVTGRANYNTTRKTLRLNAPKINEQSPSDITYVYNGYAPASVRLAQFVVKPGWRAITDLLRILPEPTVEEVQQIPISLRPRRNSGTSTQSSPIDDQKRCLVFFLGGCTLAEVSALRFLSKQPDCKFYKVLSVSVFLLILFCSKCEICGGDDQVNQW